MLIGMFLICIYLSSLGIDLNRFYSYVSFVEFIIPKMMLLILGVISTVTAATVRFPGSEVEKINHPSSFLDPDTFGGKSQLYGRWN